jgi:hypothetical protein
MLVLNAIIPGKIWEAVYAQGIFVVVRKIYDWGWSWSPLPLFYVLLGIILWRTITWFRARKSGALYLVSKAAGGIAFLVLTFYVLWAFNYHKAPVANRLGYDFSTVEEQDILNEFAVATDELNQKVMALPFEFHSEGMLEKKVVNDREIRPWVQRALQELNLAHRGNVRVRQLWPNGILLRFGTAGIYIPQTGEGHIDYALLSVQKPFTIAHEMAHGYGITDEGECNFIAWLACRISDDPYVQYSGALGYWRYAAAEINADSVTNALASLPPTVKRTLELIRKNDRKYPDLMPKIRDAIYSSYLKRHGVIKGLRSYNEVVLLVSQYRNTGSD